MTVRAKPEKHCLCFSLPTTQRSVGARDILPTARYPSPLPLTNTHLDINLGAIESTIASVHPPLALARELVQHFAQGSFGHIPQGGIAHSLLRLRGKLQLAEKSIGEDKGEGLKTEVVKDNPNEVPMERRTPDTRKCGPEHKGTQHFNLTRLFGQFLAT